MQMLELANHLACLHVPNLDGSVVASAHETSARGIIGQSAHKEIVASECA